MKLFHMRPMASAPEDAITEAASELISWLASHDATVLFYARFAADTFLVLAAVDDASWRDASGVLAETMRRSLISCVAIDAGEHSRLVLDLTADMQDSPPVYKISSENM